jgi:hypothetical protein
VAFVLGLVALPAAAGSVIQSEMTASALMQVSGGSLDGCGMRVVAVARDGGPTITAVDFSFNFYRSGTSMVKAGVRTADMNSPKEVQTPLIRPIAGFWLRAVGQPATSPDKVGFIKSESPKGYLLYGATAEAVGPLFGAAFDGRTVQVGLRFANEDSDRILSGTIKDPGSEFKEVSRCMAELTDTMKQESKPSETKVK